MSRAPGFTALELVFVLALILIISAIGMPLAQSAVAAQQLDATAGAVASALTRARSEALKRNRMVWVEFDDEERTFQVQTFSDTGDIVEVAPPEYLPGMIDLVGIADSTLQVGFDAMGRVENPGMTIHLRSARLQTQKSVVVAITGRVVIP